MEAMLPVLFVGVFIVVAILAFIFAQKAKEARRQAFAAFAARHGFQMVEPEPPGCLSGGLFNNAVVGDPGFIEGLADVSPFNTGDSRAITLMAHGPKDGSAWYVFDYKYSTGSGKNRQTHYISAVVAVTALAFPYLTIRHQGFLDEVGGALGFKDIQFESDDFNKRFFVKCEDERRAYDIVHPQMMEYLMSLPQREMNFRMNLFVTVDRGRSDIMELERMMVDMQGLLELLPAYVKQDIGLGRVPPVIRMPNR